VEVNIHYRLIMFGMATFSRSSASATPFGGVPVRVCQEGQLFVTEGMVAESCASVLKDLKRYFQNRPKYVAYLNVHIDVKSKPDERNISQVCMNA